MEITYKRDLKHNYLIIVPEETFYDSYEIRMMASNCIDGLLKFHVKQIDDKKSYYYEITSKQPLNRLLDYQNLGTAELHSLIAAIAQTLGRLETYLLQESQILLQPDFIYVQPEYFTVYLCLVPGRQGVFPEEMTALLQYLLGKVNHQDKESVVLAYGLYQESLKENYGMGDLMRLAGRDYTKDKKEAGGEEKYIEEISRQADRIEADKNTSINAGAKTGINKEWKQEWEERMQEEREKKVSENGALVFPDRQGELLRNFLIFCAALFGGPAFCWLLYGENGLRKYWLLLAALDVVTGFILAARRVILTSSAAERPAGRTSDCQAGPRFPDNQESRRFGDFAGKNRNHREENSHSWQMIFQEETEDEAERAGGKKRNAELNPQNEDCGTVLLTETCAPPNSRYLHSMENGIDDIVIAYVPFIIGKQEGLADHVLSCDTVSRLHARIDREGEIYRITDLNSTNGTMVGGRMLETNEAAVLSAGDQVYIANIGFIFT